MASTVFTKGTPIVSSWLNDVNTATYVTLPAVSAVASAAQTTANAAMPTATLAASGGSGLVGFLQAGTGAVARTLQDKSREVVSVKDFGAKGDGSTDDTAAIQAAINASQYVYFPAGQYKISASIKWTNQWLVGAVDNGQLSQASNQTMILPTGDFPAFVYFHPSGYNSQGGGIRNFNVFYSGTAPSSPNNKMGIRVPAAGSSGYPAFHTFENITVQGATWAIYDSSGSWMAKWKNINGQNNYAGYYKVGGTTHVLENCYHRGGYGGYYFASILGVAVINSAVDLCSSAVGGYYPVYVSNSTVMFSGCDFEGNILTSDYTSDYVFTGSRCLVEFHACNFLSPDVRATTTEQYLIKADSSAKVVLTGCDFSTPSLTGNGGLFAYGAAFNSANIKFDRCVMPALTGGTPGATYSGLAFSGSVDYDNCAAPYQWAGYSRQVDRSLRGSASATLGSITNGSSASTAITVTGAALGDFAEAAFSTALPTGVVVAARVSAADTVTVTVANLSGSTQTISAATITVKVVPK